MREAPFPLSTYAVRAYPLTVETTRTMKGKQMNETRITIIIDPALFRPALPKPIFPVKKKRRVKTPEGLHLGNCPTVPFGQGR